MAGEDIVVTIGADASGAQAAVQGFQTSNAANFVLIGQQVDRAIGQFSRLANGISDSFGGAVDSFGDFDQAMANVRSIAVGTNESFEEMDQLAKELASTMPTTSTAIAEGMFGLASAGLSANEIMEVTPDIMNLAAASATDFETAANGVTAAVFTFGLEMSDAQEVTEIFQNTNKRFKTTMPELADSMRFAGAAGSALGLEMSQVAATIGIARNVGLEASQAGTGLRQVFLSLAAPTQGAAEAMADYGFQVAQTDDGSLDLQQTFINLRGVTEGIQDPLERAAFLEEVFSKRGFVVAQALVAQADSLDSLSIELTEQGAVADAVAIQNEGLKNQMAILNGAIEEQQIALGEQLAPAVLFATGAKLKMLEAVNALPGPFIEWGGGILLVGAELGKLIFPLIQMILQTVILFAAMGAQTAATAGATAATGAHTAATTTYTVAQTAANIALALFPIVAIVLGIIALIAIIVLLVKNWDKVTAVMTSLWDFIVGQFIIGWDAIKNTLGFLSPVIGFLIKNWELLLAIVFPFIGIPLLIIKNWDLLVSFLPGVFGDIAEAFGDMASKAFKWGSDLIGEFIGGITSRVADVAGAAGDILGAIGGFIGFDIAANDRMAAQWGQDLGQFFAQGMGSAIPDVALAGGDLIGAAAGGTAPVGGGGAAGGVTINFNSGAIALSGSAGEEDGRRLAKGLREEFLRSGVFSGRGGVTP